MEVRKKMVDVYIVEGKEFLNKERAIAYEKQIKQQLDCEYYIVSYSPDLTEGRGYYKKMIVAVPKRAVSNVIYHYLVKRIGDPVEFVMGIVPINNWIISNPYKFDNFKDLEKFLNEEVMVGVGDFRKPKKLEVVYINEHGRNIGSSSV